MFSRVLWPGLTLLGLALAGPLSAQEPGGGPRPGGGRVGGGMGAPPAARQPIRPYADVVTKEAKTESGLLKVHQIGERLLYEIPTSVLNKELLWVITFAQTQTGAGFAGTEVQDRVVRWV
ncbi:MAG: DUF5118 domain-containing protein, partial [Armatimonadetes bacterium]|nr:DUF5118 domain-containing protein [Armatimonadota bacterium]